GRRMRSGGGCARGRRSASLVRLRGGGCRHRGRNDKNCCAAGVPLEHDTDLLALPQESTPRWRAGFTCEGAAPYMRLTWRATNSMSTRSEIARVKELGN